MLNFKENTMCKYMDAMFYDYMIYEESLTHINNIILQMVKVKDEKFIAIFGSGVPFDDFEGEQVDDYFKLCPLSHKNRLILNKHLDYTRPRAFGRKTATFGTGDRLGLATPGHIEAFSGSVATPILAQQSKRELNLTGRTYADVLDDVTFAVFQKGYKGGFGADGDHLKEEVDVIDALDNGVTMITIDCSEKIGKGIERLSSFELKEAYSNISVGVRKNLEKKYLDRSFDINGLNIKFSEKELMENALIYLEAIQYIVYIYNKHIATCARPIDYEISIDETEETTSQYGHYFVATELMASKVNFTSLAPRFIGEFQKGIDYIGDIHQFEEHLKMHSTIADFFGYKLSIHSGSDKFSVFDLIGRYTKGRLHVKTSGTNWLEAIGAIAECNPDLYREIHKYALLHFDEARQFYHVSADLNNIPDLDIISDDKLKYYLTEDHSRQLLHITYGFILENTKLKTAIYETLRDNETLYSKRLELHIGRHIDEIGL